MDGQRPQAEQLQELQLLEQLLENQVRDFDLRSREMELERQKDAHSFQYSKDALAAQERDRKHGRECRRGERRDQYGLIIAVAVVVAGLVSAALVLGHKDVALELAKAVVLITAGAVGGYGLANKRRRQPDPAE